jgi:uncharacterized protein YjbI with pentapeptide repeats
MPAKYLLNKAYKDINFGIEAINYTDFERCTFAKCTFTHCDFTAVAFIDCQFTYCNFNEAKINYVALRNAVFNECSFIGVNFAMVDKFIFEVGFNHCLLDYAQFYTLKLKSVRFNHCSLIAADFMKTDLTDVIFDNCNLHKAVFVDTIARKTDFSSSYNYSLDPEKNKLKKAIFSLNGVKGLLDKHNIIVI